MQGSGSESTGRIRGAMAAFLARGSSRRSVEATGQSGTTLAAVGTAATMGGESVAPWWRQQGVAFCGAGAIAEGSRALQIHGSKSQYSQLTYSKSSIFTQSSSLSFSLSLSQSLDTTTF